MSNQLLPVRGAGGDSKGGGGGGGGNEADDTLRSRQMASIIDVLCEGPIVGLVNGEQSIFLNETPLKNADGSYNFKNVYTEWKTGTQQQAPLTGIDDVQEEIGVNVQVKHDFPVVRSVTNPDVNAIRVTVSVPRLTETSNETGDINGSSVSLQIDIQADGSGFVTRVDDTISGKTSSKYQRTYLIEVNGDGPWDIRVRRTSSDSTLERIQNDLYFDSYTAITYAQLSYPNTALVGVKIDAEQFNQIPSRAYGIRGLIVQVPSNYDPATRSYLGVWDGTFKPAWTDNPAWCFYDLLTNTRYGTGDYIFPESIDKWTLYQIARYCDQMVPDGFGGMEPRFTCNLYLQTREDAYKVIQNFASIFRAITFWGAGTVITMQDRPGDGIAQQYTNSNVVDGIFEYSGTSVRNRHTVALVAWNDPLDFYRQKIEYVQDDEGIKELGVVKTDIVAFGCASRGQARRMGRWLLATERMATETVMFKAGIDSLACYPGAIIETSDINRAGKRMGGRIVSSTYISVDVDAPVTISADEIHQVKLVMPDGTMVTRTLVNGPGPATTLLFSQPLTTLPLDGSIFVVAAVNLQPETWRVLGVKEADGEEHNVEITALAHLPGLFEYVEENIAFDVPQISILGVLPPTPTNLQFVSSHYQIDGDVVGLRGSLSWTGREYSYRVKWKRVNGSWQQKTVYEPTIDFDNFDDDTYTFRVTAINLAGKESGAAELVTGVNPAPVPLADITGLSLEGPFTSSTASFKWDACPGALAYETRVREATNGALVHQVNVGNALRLAYSADDMRGDGGPWRRIIFEVRALGRFGAVSAWATVSAENPQIGALNGVQVDGGIKSLLVKVAKPDDGDFAGIRVWVGTSANYDPTDSTLVYDGPETLVVIQKLGDGSPVIGNVDYYVRVAAYDDLGKDELTISGSVLVRALLNAPDANTISAQMIQDGALELTKFASGLTPVGFVDGLPDPIGYTGPKIVSNTQDNQLYRWEAPGVWQPGAVAHIDSGSVNDDALGPALKSRIDLIDGPESMPGSVADRIAKEAQAIGEVIGAVAEEVDYQAAMQDIAIAAAQFALKSQTTSQQAQNTRTSALAAKLGEHIGALISEEQVTRASAIDAVAYQVSLLSADYNDNKAVIEQSLQSISNQTTATAQSLITLQSTVSGHTSSIQSQQTSIDGLHARVEVKIDNNGAISGYALDSTTDRNGAVTSAFTVKVDAFKIIGTGTSATPVFSVWTKDGQQTIGMNGAVIVDGTITTRNIQAGAITTTELAANAVTASKLFVGAQGAALNRDPSMLDASSWATLNNITFTTTAVGAVGNNVARSSTGFAGTMIGGENIPVDLSRVYRIKGRVYRTASANGSASLGVQMRDSSGAIVQDSASNIWTFVTINAASLASGGWTDISATMNVASSKLFTTNCKTMTPVALLNTGGNAGYMDIQDLRIEEVLPGTLIQDGVITTAKLVSGAVTADKVAANAITTDKLAANAITADKLAADSVTANAIAAGAITAGKLSVTSLSAITATIGTLRTRSSGARLEISDDVIKVYGADGVTVRVQIGDMSK